MVIVYADAGKVLNWEVESDGFFFNHEELKEMRENDYITFNWNQIMYVISYQEIKEFNTRNITDHQGMYGFPIIWTRVLDQKTLK